VILWRCDQCPTTSGPDDPGDWIIISLITADLAHGDPDDTDPAERPQHFCSWRCAGTYATARALVDSWHALVSTWGEKWRRGRRSRYSPI
jgi:hypothetical protein